MLNTFNKLLKLAFIFSTVITSWTLIVLLSNSSLNLEIKELINKMYLNQKSFIYNVKGLSILLVKDANERFYDYKQNSTRVNNSNNNN